MTAVRYAGTTPVARQIERRAGERLLSRDIDYGADGTIDVTETFDYDDAGRVVTVRREGVTGSRIIRYSYCGAPR